MAARKAKKVVLNPKVPRTRGGGTLTESQYFGKIRSALRNCFRYWPPLQEALKKASRPSKHPTNKRLKTEYQCADCLQWFARKDVEIDHIIECGSLRCYDDIPGFLERLTTEDKSSYQILCKKDHAAKSKIAIDIKKKKK